MFEGNFDFSQNSSWISPKNDNTIGKKYRFLDIMRYKQNPFGRNTALQPKFNQIGAKRFGCENIKS